MQEQDFQKFLAIRFNLLLFLAFFSFSIIILRLAYIQIANGSQYTEIANQKSNIKMVIPAMRGNIYDRRGNMIATSKGTYTAVFKETDRMTKVEFLKLATKLEPVLGMDRKKILNLMDCGWKMQNGCMVETGRQMSKFSTKDLKYDLSPHQIAFLSEHRLDFPGVHVEVKPIRVYNEKQVAVQTVGYVRKYGVAQTSRIIDYMDKTDLVEPDQMVGFDGVEFSYEKYLQGKNGSHLYQITADQQIQKEIGQIIPQQGNSLFLTLDERVQLESRDFIKRFLPALKNKGSNHPRTAYAVAMEVKTGKIVAMISYPEYDPNIWTKNLLDTNDYNQIQYSLLNGTIRSAPYDVRPLTGKDAETEVAKHPSSLVPTGSVIKPATLMMGLGEKIISPQDKWLDQGDYHYGRGSDSVHNDSYDIYGFLTPQKALEKSSNTYVARIGDLTQQKYGKKAISIMKTYHQAFGLGVKTKVDLPFESKGIQDFLTMDKVYGSLAAMVQSSFGQQTHYTVLQLAQYAATLANNGIRIQPQIVDRIVDRNGNTVRRFNPQVLSRFYEPDIYWKTIREGMGRVSKNGTAGRVFAGFPFHIAAKTGTSDQDIFVKSTDSNNWYKYGSASNGVFISYAPIDRPKLAVAVVVPEGGYGAGSAAVIARQVYESYNRNIGLD
ncbi:penicillin-binding protein 2 [Aneurinibacillus sp. Ricciae_BoGa-3]|uniref:peptidoglycan D,D-transpeptidase FtsI family protein n=1 Tax=Aneurinibacillus sp. Ricciae_BoGa-3 TaxID=3022697 RepID=UPI00233FEFFB|nr:penicillin-binding protein 2 [Aneurinibacillus sp. Ricciae_BoGa-3]WCK56342.1 penicillin-binding protein 2 [Aneurinibacillus sp. Ricciae_BoGa-3]